MRKILDVITAVAWDTVFVLPVRQSTRPVAPTHLTDQTQAETVEMPAPVVNKMIGDRDLQLPESWKTVTLPKQVAAKLLRVWLKEQQENKK
jgi:hypothetical protein